MASLAVAVAVLSVTASLHLLANYDRQTQQEIRALQYRSQERMDALENDARIFAKSLGFNILIYNRAQRLETFYIEDVNTDYLTIGQAHELAASELGILNHHLPFLRHRYSLPAFNGEVIIAGLEGEIFIKQSFQQPLEVCIEPGEVQLGSTVAERLHVKVGDTLSIGDASYKVTLCRKPLGTKDDIVLFMNLADAQALLGLEDEISGILGLSCNCAAGNIAPIRKSVQRIIPDAEVVEFATRAKARQTARAAIKKAAEAEVADIVKSRQTMRLQLEHFSLFFAGLIVAVAAALLLFLYSHNVKERRHEIAILRTLGVRTLQLVWLFTAKAALLAAVGTVIGTLGALALLKILIASAPFSSILFFKLLVAACLVSIFASLIPVLIAVRREPGMVLNEEV
ncbi:ABC transporter permease [Pontiella sulfatireligans]|uniref:ABC transporter permease n=1 Tax=Pontiella sulfatireligans TaxID=2750658 RepID=UPI00144428B2|nr:FtsX-like permease family protein [Pontiella sulfatireligans]